MEFRDCSDRLNIELAKDGSELSRFVRKLRLLGGYLIQKLDDGCDCSYCDFRFDDLVVVLHWHAMSGIDLYCEGQQDDAMLREIASRLFISSS